MANFPTLSQNPAINWGEKKAFDPTIRSKAEGGYVQTRSRFTRLPKKWEIKYKSISTADKDLIEAHEDTQRVGADKFNWTNPLNSTVYEVRYLEPIDYKIAGAQGYWDVEFILEQV